MTSLQAMNVIPRTNRVPSCSYKNTPIFVQSNIIPQKSRHFLKGVGLAINCVFTLIKSIINIWNASYAYIKYTHDHIAQNILEIQTVVNIMMITNQSQLKYIKSIKVESITKLFNSQKKIRKFLQPLIPELKRCSI